MSDGFAPPLNKLGDSGVGVAAAPTGGMGFALTPDGKLPSGVLFTGTSAYRVSIGTQTGAFDNVVANSHYQVTITHNLGTTPAMVIAQAGQGGQSLGIWVDTDTYTATTFRLTATLNVQGAQSVTYCWVAIG